MNTTNTTAGSIASLTADQALLAAEEKYQEAANLRAEAAKNNSRSWNIAVENNHKHTRESLALRQKAIAQRTHASILVEAADSLRENN